MNFSVINKTLLQIYSSALIFTSSINIIQRFFKNLIPIQLSFQLYINKDQNIYLSILKGHNNWVQLVVFLYNLKLVAPASYDIIVQIQSIKIEKCKQVLKGYRKSVRSVVFSYNLKLVASASGDITVWIQSVEMEKCEQILEGHSNWVSLVVFSHDLKLVASASNNITVQIQSIKMGKYEQVLEGHSNQILSVVFSHNLKLVASASHNITVRIQSVKIRKCEQVLEGHSESVSSVVFSYNSKLVASASHNITVRIQSVEIGKYKQVIRQNHYIQVLSFTTNNINLITGNRAIPIARESITSTESLALSPSSVQILHIKDCIQVSYKGKNLFLLPAEYRNGTTAILGDNIAISCNSGKVILLLFLSNKLKQLIDRN